MTMILSSMLCSHPSDILSIDYPILENTFGTASKGMKSRYSCCPKLAALVKP